MTIGAVSASLTAADKFTGDVTGVAQAETGQAGISLSGYFNLSISGVWVGTLTLQRSFDSGVTWLDVETYTSNVQKRGLESETGVRYRTGFKATGAYTSGTAVARLSR